MSSLKQLNTDEEKYKLFRQVLEQYEKTGVFKLPELAEALDFHKNTLYKVRKGTINPPDILIYKFCEYYKLNPAYFFGREKKLTALKQDIQPISQVEAIRLHEIGLEVATLAAKLLHKK